MEENIAKPVVNKSGSDSANNVPIHLQPPAENQRGLPTEESTEADQLHAQEAVVDDSPLQGPQEFWKTSPLFYEISQYFNVKEGDYDKAKDKLSVIVDCAIEDGKSDKPEDIMVHLRKLEEQLVNPEWGVARYENVFKYIRLAQRRTAFDKAMSAYRKTGPNGQSNW